jgi:hypothetical protein
VIGRGIKIIEPKQNTTRNILKLVGNNMAFPTQNKRYGNALFFGPLYVYHNTSLIVDDFGFQSIFPSTWPTIPGTSSRGITSS